MKEELLTTAIAALPISELRGAIPFAIEVLKLKPVTAFIWGVIGNMVPPLIILWLIDPSVRWLERRIKIFGRFINWVFAHSRNRVKPKVIKWGELGLVIFVATPLPFTGAWTGSIGAYLLGIPRKHAILEILLGVIIAGAIVTLAHLGIVKAFRIFL